MKSQKSPIFKVFGLHLDQNWAYTPHSFSQDLPHLGNPMNIMRLGQFGSLWDHEWAIYGAYMGNIRAVNIYLAENFSPLYSAFSRRFNLR